MNISNIMILVTIVIVLSVATFAFQSYKNIPLVGASSQDYSFVKRWGSTGSNDGQFGEPSDLTMDQKTGNIFVSDSGNNRIETFDQDGKLLSSGHTQVKVMVNLCILMGLQ